MTDRFVEYYRCPDRYSRFQVAGSPSGISGYFRLGDSTCYGRYCGRDPSSSAAESLFDAHPDIVLKNCTAFLPFDLTEVTDNIRNEVYATAGKDSSSHAIIKRMYYFLRPLLPVTARKHLQKNYLAGWDKKPFPHWPVDRSVDEVFEQLLLLSLRTQGMNRIPFIWFWPDGALSCAIMTHDVETAAGRDLCAKLMDIDDSFGIKASFQVVPERRYEVTERYLDSIVKRGFELAVHDLNHDGLLYTNRQQFMRRAARINAYGREWKAEGFRSAILYRRQEWFDALDFAYDTSIPNVAHLDPQHGGCCTVMPYFVGKILELPVTMTQDYSLFHMLNDYSIRLWQQQISLIMEKHGLANVIIHPDYITSPRERGTFEELLAYLDRLRSEKSLWIALPRDVNAWWRQRAKMQLIEDSNGLRIEGTGKERARIAYASEQNGRLDVTFNELSSDNTPTTRHLLPLSAASRADPQGSTR